MHVLVSFNKQLKYFRQYFSCALHINGRNSTISVTGSEGRKGRKSNWIVFANQKYAVGTSTHSISWKKESGDDGLSQLCINNRGSKYAYILFNSSSYFQQNIIQEN